VCGPLQSGSAAQRIGYVTPLAKLEGREPQIFAEPDRKIEVARKERQRRREPASSPSVEAVDAKHVEAKEWPSCGFRGTMAPVESAYQEITKRFLVLGQEQRAWT